jgi:hypothetical protein
MSSGKRWSRNEDRVLREGHEQKLPIEKLQELLPGRTLRAIGDRIAGVIRTPNQRWQRYLGKPKMSGDEKFIRKVLSTLTPQEKARMIGVVKAPKQSTERFKTYVPEPHGFGNCALAGD